jgi:hypothetical protein
VLYIVSIIQPTPPGLDLFWEQADQDGAPEHPLERELQHRMDVLARYQKMITEAEANGHEDAVDAFLSQHERQEQLCRELRLALDRARNRDHQ